MHLLEAMVEWFDITRDQYFYDELSHLIKLFQNRLYVDGTIREYFDADWLPVSGNEGLLIEPGHMAEWAWILDRLAMIDNNKTGLSAKLMKFVKSCHQKNDIGLIFDIVGPNFEVIKSSSRLWPQTEFIKGLITEISNFKDVSATLMKNHIDLIFERFIKPAPNGGWLEQLDVNGRPIVDFIPASSLYHISLAFTEIIRINEDLKKPAFIHN